MYQLNTKRKKGTARGKIDDGGDADGGGYLGKSAVVAQHI